MNNAIKKILKLKDKSNDLYLVLSMIIDQFNSDSKKDKGELEYTILPERDKYLKFEKEKYPSIHIFTDDIYYDRTYAGVMMYNRLKRSCLQYVLIFKNKMCICDNYLFVILNDY